jgi:hypothetical protein
MQFRNGNISWNIFFTRPVHDWEVKVVSALFECLYSQRVRLGGDVKNCSISSKRKLFKVKPYYHVLSTPISFHFSCKSIWKV